jgi:hypothetical protein
MDGEKSLRSKSVVIRMGWRKADEGTIRMPPDDSDCAQSFSRAMRWTMTIETSVATQTSAVKPGRPSM